jgi:hypothetical protein
MLLRFARRPFQRSLLQCLVAGSAPFLAANPAAATPAGPDDLNRHQAPGPPTRQPAPSYTLYTDDRPSGFYLGPNFSEQEAHDIMEHRAAVTLNGGAVQRSGASSKVGRGQGGARRSDVDRMACLTNLPPSRRRCLDRHDEPCCTSCGCCQRCGVCHAW